MSDVVMVATQRVSVCDALTNLSHSHSHCPTGSVAVALTSMSPAHAARSDGGCVDSEDIVALRLRAISAARESTGFRFEFKFASSATPGESVIKGRTRPGGSDIESSSSRRRS